MAIINGFRVRYKSWPSKIRLPKPILIDLKTLFREQTFAKIEDRLELIVDNTPIVAEDEYGRTYSYGEQGFPEHHPEIGAKEWLGIQPDRIHDMENSGTIIEGAKDELSIRKSERFDPHIAPLTTFVDWIRADQVVSKEVPYFDPWDGGIHAKVLFLLEAPGPKSVECDFVSRDIEDPTAKNLDTLIREAGIPRKDIVIWNVVPWYIGDGQKIRPATKSDIDSGQKYLERLFSLLPRLEAVVLLGKNAQKAKKIVESSINCRIFETYHPSNQVFNRSKDRWGKVKCDLQKVSKFLYQKKIR
jgi:uracil-DNA glycosylase family 4